MHDLIYAGVPLGRHSRRMAWLIRWFSRTRGAQERPTVVPRDDLSVRMLDAAFLALPEDSRTEVRGQLMQAIVTFERTNDVAPLVDFVQSVLITAKLRSNQEYRSALEDAEAESWDEPGVDVEAMIEAAHERRRAAQRQAR